MTKDEHYVPQVYLKGFSPEYELYKGDKKTKCTIYYYDVKRKEQCYKAVPVKSVCFKKYIYELTNAKGEYVYQNLLENKLGKIETMFGEYRRKIESKAFNEENYKTHCFLTREEKIFWITFILLQLLRSPRTLEVAETISKEMFEGSLNDNQARNLSRLLCLPLYKEIEENSPEAGLLNLLIGPMLNMSFVVCVDRNGRFITSDNSMYIYCPEFPCEEYERVIFPITSQICLILLGGKEKEKCEGKNFLIPAEDELCKMIFIDIFRSASEKIFANHILDSEELGFIEEISKGMVTL